MTSWLSRYIYQIQYGCRNPACSTPTCLSYRKRVAKTPVRRYSKLSARALACFLVQDKNPEAALCPHEPVVLPNTNSPRTRTRTAGPGRSQPASALKHSYEPPPYEVTHRHAQVTTLPSASKRTGNTSLDGSATNGHVDLREPGTVSLPRTKVAHSRKLRGEAERFEPVEEESRKDPKSFTQNLFDSLPLRMLAWIPLRPRHSPPAVMGTEESEKSAGIESPTPSLSSANAAYGSDLDTSQKTGAIRRASRGLSNGTWHPASDKNVHSDRSAFKDGSADVEVIKEQSSEPGGRSPQWTRPCSKLGKIRLSLEVPTLSRLSTNILVDLDALYTTAKDRCERFKSVCNKEPVQQRTQARTDSTDPHLGSKLAPAWETLSSPTADKADNSTQLLDLVSIFLKQSLFYCLKDPIRLSRSFNVPTVGATEEPTENSTSRHAFGRLAWINFSYMFKLRPRDEILQNVTYSLRQLRVSRTSLRFPCPAISDIAAAKVCAIGLYALLRFACPDPPLSIEDLQAQDLCRKWRARSYTSCGCRDQNCPGVL